MPKPRRSKERELAFIEEHIRAAEQGAPSGRLIRQALLAGLLSTATIRRATEDEEFRAYLVAWIEVNERAALAGEEHVLSMQEAVDRVMAYYGAERG